MPTLIERVAAVQALKEEYQGRALCAGEVDCAALVHSHLTRLAIPCPSVPRYRTFRGGFMALKKMGFADLGALLDSILTPISPASMLPGDIGLMEGCDAEAMVIHAGRFVIGFHEEVDVLANIVRPSMKRAWSIG